MTSYDESVADRFSLLAEQGADTCADALQAMTWADPSEDDLRILYGDAKKLSDALERYRTDHGWEA